MQRARNLPPFLRREEAMPARTSQKAYAQAGGKWTFTLPGEALSMAHSRTRICTRTRPITPPTRCCAVGLDSGRTVLSQMRMGYARISYSHTRNPVFGCGMKSGRPQSELFTRQAVRVAHTRPFELPIVVGGNAQQRKTIKQCMSTPVRLNSSAVI